MTNETAQSISRWAEETFGPVKSNYQIAVRANLEMAELLKELASDDSAYNTLEEIADIVIVLARIVDREGQTLQGIINDKMIVNRARQWKLDGNGQGYHV